MEEKLHVELGLKDEALSGQRHLQGEGQCLQPVTGTCLIVLLAQPNSDSDESIHTPQEE